MLVSVFILIAVGIALWKPILNGGGKMPDEMKSNVREGKFNRLIDEKSPYLLQHAGNPVNWYPWGNDAFERARIEDKPIFLSIGYSTCHWCHVMAHESFEDSVVAELMNDAFISVKVDREERPDIDNIYMTVCQMLTGSGGWPLSIVMTPDKKPFFAATYIPKDARFGRVGMMELIPQIKNLWIDRRDEILQSADQITESLVQPASMDAGGELSESIFTSAFEQFFNSYDKRFGGFGRAPKFPTPHNFLFLLRYWRRSGDSRALEMVENTLTSMRRGGVYDQLGFGFHRYSTDPQWLLPHFEKMLYDQALLAMAYVETYLAAGKPEFKETAEEIFSYVLRDMTSESGAFYSAEDADSEGEEGKFYLWTEKEITEVLDHDDAQLAIRVFNIERDGNFEDQASGRRTGANILYLNKSIHDIATSMGLSDNELKSRLAKIRAELFEHRRHRPRPHKDDKILTDWNGLMIAALALGSQAFDKPEYADAAGKAANFIMGNMRGPGDRLLHRFRDGEAAIAANIDDYSFLIWGLLNLYEATFDGAYLKKALDLNSVMIDHFWDDNTGTFYFTSDDAEKLPTRPREVHDGAVPSGNSVAALNILRLGRITANLEFDAKAELIVNSSTGQVRRAPQAFSMLLSAFDFAAGPTFEIAVVGLRGADDANAMLTELRRRFIPNKVVIFVPSGQNANYMAEFAAFTNELKMIDGKATAYICKNFSCDKPTNDLRKLIELLDGLSTASRN
jgi:uncharacterized protein YyaL (SSP411 family)